MKTYTNTIEPRKSLKSYPKPPIKHIVDNELYGETKKCPQSGVLLVKSTISNGVWFILRNSGQEVRIKIVDGRIVKKSHALQNYEYLLLKRCTPYIGRPSKYEI